MARVELSAAAVEDIARLTITHRLPADTNARIRRSLRALGRLPRLGAALEGEWQGFRFVLGPWRWMIVVYEIYDDDRIVIVTVQDDRSYAALAVRFAASTPTGRLEQVAEHLGVPGAPAGTTDAFLAESRAERDQA